MKITENIDKDLLSSMKNHDKLGEKVYKAIKAKIMEFKTAKNAKPFDEQAEISLLRKMIKERQESANIYFENKRDDLGNEEKSEAEFIEKLIDKSGIKSFSDEEISDNIKKEYPDGIEKKMMGSVIKEYKEKYFGIDGKELSDIVRKFII